MDSAAIGLILSSVLLPLHKNGRPSPFGKDRPLSACVIGLALMICACLAQSINPRANAFGDRAVWNDSGSEDSMGFTADFRNNSCQMRLPSTGFLLEIAKCACTAINPSSL